MPVDSQCPRCFGNGEPVCPVKITQITRSRCFTSPSLRSTSACSYRRVVRVSILQR